MYVLTTVVALPTEPHERLCSNHIQRGVAIGDDDGCDLRVFSHRVRHAFSSFKARCPSIASFASAWSVAVPVRSSAPSTAAPRPSTAWRPSSPAHSRPIGRNHALRARAALDPACVRQLQEMAEREERLPPTSGSTSFRSSRRTTSIPGAQGVHRARDPCHLRQADDHDARGRGGALPTRAGARRRVRADAQLQRLPTREAGARPGARRQAGSIRKVVAEYSQGWLSTRIEATGKKQADWRTDPARAGAGRARRHRLARRASRALCHRASRSSSSAPT